MNYNTTNIPKIVFVFLKIKQILKKKLCSQTSSRHYCR